MASYKSSRSVVFVDSLPRSESNKINWRLLQDVTGTSINSARAHASDHRLLCMGLFSIF